MTKKQQRIRIRPLLWFNYLMILLLLLSNLTPVVAPDMFWPISILGLVFPVLVLINILFFVYWLVISKRYLFYSLLALILSYSLILDHFQLNKREKTKPENSVSILTFNAHNLSNTNINRGDKKIRDSIMYFVKKHDADIVCFQEFQSYPTRGVNTITDYQKILGHQFVSYIPYLKKNTHEFLDLMVLYSDYPLINQHPFYMDGKSYGFYVDAIIEKDTIRIFNLHLESNHFTKNDYEIFSEKEVNLNERKRNQILLLLQKIKKYSIKRSYQAQTIRSEINRSPYPVIVAGDFNDTPSSYATNHIRQDLKDAFRKKGRGYGNTFNADLPPMRIDYLLFNNQMEILDFEIIKTELSDHYPLKVTFKINPK